MKAAELLRLGRPEEALGTLQDEVRQNAQDPERRTFLFQLLCVLGQWDRALTQLEVLSSLEGDYAMLARIFQPVVQCERLRDGVFAGLRTPVVFGEPLDWMGKLVNANQLAVRQEFDAAANLRDQAFEQAPVTPGTLEGREFDWIADADTRLGPVLEVVIEGCYYWAPFCRIKSIRLEAPVDLRDLIWMPAHFVWENEGEAFGHIPTRYPGTEQSTEGSLRLARKTEWQTPAAGFSFGLGQRVLATNAEEVPLLECRVIEFRPAD